MHEDVKEWLVIAKRDLKTAAHLFPPRDYAAASFFCQQAAEKALKAVQLARTGRIRRIHDLVELGRDVGLPENLLLPSGQLTLAYTFTRYPDVEGQFGLETSAKQFLKLAKKIVLWTETQLS